MISKGRVEEAQREGARPTKNKGSDDAEVTLREVKIRWERTTINRWQVTATTAGVATIPKVAGEAYKNTTNAGLAVVVCEGEVCIVYIAVTTEKPAKTRHRDQGNRFLFKIERLK